MMLCARKCGVTTLKNASKVVNLHITKYLLVFTDIWLLDLFIDDIFGSQILILMKVVM